MAPLIQCDYCSLLFHMDCLDPPLTAFPAGKWMCPNHVEHLVVRSMVLLVGLFSYGQSTAQQNNLFISYPAESEEPETVQPLSALRSVSRQDVTACCQVRLPA